ncbi:MAG: hypothetical protein HOP12_09780 [Candidatus Eisenbacteria bacterium]|uniref:YjbH domain-containing protein n=1 Tax=Eiseniibacteriota bacterium TaxID=2212470 RepID=A0A849SIK4_UNCEI|nr:hypothetical protein [Candidatus Eisenbacteria bacterium]
MSRRVAWLAMALTCASGCDAAAQDFGLPEASPLASPAAGWLERGVSAPFGHAGPPDRGGLRFVVESGFISWFGVPELSTRALAVGARWRGLALAAGISQTGDGELGWTTIAGASGLETESGGAAMRTVARRDRALEFAFDLDAPGWGFEAGAGGWVRASRDVRAWISAPSLWSDGAAAPLARGLEWGAEWRTAGLFAWFSHQSAPLAGEAAGASVALGAGCDLGRTECWVTGRDHPFRAGAGLALRLAQTTLRLDVEEHPQLGTTLRAALAFGSSRSANPERADLVP